jgi:hypothetical protein
VGYPRSLGLENNILIQGLASKVITAPPQNLVSKDTVLIQGDGWYDVRRSYALWDSVFKARAGIIKEGQWIDRPSVSMPAMYLFAGTELSDALRSTGQLTEARNVFSQTRQIAAATGLGDLLRSAEASFTTPTGGDSPGVPLLVNPGTQPPAAKASEPVKTPAKKTP